MRKGVKTRQLWLGVLAGALVLLVAMPSYAFSSREAAALSLRINRLEAQLRELTGKMEEQAHRLELMQQRFERFAQDTEFRFNEIKPGKGGVKRRSRVRPAPRPAPLPAPRSQPEFSGNDRGFGDEEPLDAARAATIRPLGVIPGSALNLELNPDDRMLAGAAPERNPQESYDQAYGLILRRDYKGAQRAFKAFLENYGNSSLAGNAQYWLGESYYARRQYRQAADAFLLGYTKYAKSGKAPGSLLKLGMTLFRLKQKDAGCASLAELSRKFPRASKSIKKRAARERHRAGC
ncbi:MAG TPA: tol-pal system protein YbgF [Rhizobiales bacterium]|nr:tol-pal system protein YbgF [Hyphomicrobiales bacterium]